MACNTISSGISAQCETSMGGVKKVWLANYASDAVSGTTDGEITAFKSGITWYPYTFRKGTATLTETLNVDDANGVSYVSSELVLTFGKMDTDKRVAINALALAEVMAMVLDSNGTYHFLGASEGVQATAGEGATGQARGDSNHYSITLTDNNPEFPYTVKKEIAEAQVAGE